MSSFKRVCGVLSITAALLVSFYTTPVLAGDTLSGPITGHVVWDTSGSPYVITGDILVETGDTLTIEPGVEVRFRPDSDDQGGGANAGLCEIYVNNGGRLYVNGDVSDSIIMTSDTTDPGQYDWFGISVWGSAAGSRMPFPTGPWGQ